MNGGSFGDLRDAFGVVGKGSSGGCRVGHGLPVVMALVIIASMAACG